MRQRARDHAEAAPEDRGTRTLAGTVLRVQRQARGAVPAGRASGSGGAAIRGGATPDEAEPKAGPVEELAAEPAAEPTAEPEAEPAAGPAAEPAEEPELAAPPSGLWRGEVVGNTAVARVRSYRIVNPELLVVAAVLDKARAEFKAGDRAGGRATPAYAKQLNTAMLGEVADYTPIAHMTKCHWREGMDPTLRAVAEALDEARAEFKAGGRAGGRATLAYAEQLHTTHARQAVSPAAAGGYDLCDVPAGALDNPTKSKKKKKKKKKKSGSKRK